MALAVRQREGLQARRDLSGDGPGLLQELSVLEGAGGRSSVESRTGCLPHDGAHGRQYLFRSVIVSAFISVAACWPC